MIVDEKGKLFGKINLLDCLIVLLVVCVIAAAVILSKVGSAKDGNSIPLTYTVEVKNKDAGYFAHLIEGEKVIDGVTKEALGEIVSVTTQPAVSVAQADDTLISVNIEDKLKEFVGHTPLQVFAGAVLGILIAFWVRTFY